MEAINTLTTIDYSSLFIAVFSILVGIKAIVSLLEWVIEKLGLETKWMRKKREEHELLIKTSENLLELQKKHNEDAARSDAKDEEIRNDIQDLKGMFIDKEIDDWRWKILDFSSALSNGRRYNRESFDHIIKIYEKYKKYIEQHGLENGLVDESIKFVKEKYREYLEKGLFL